MDLRGLLEVVGDEVPRIGHRAHVFLAGPEQFPGKLAHPLRVGGLELRPLLYDLHDLLGEVTSLLDKVLEVLESRVPVFRRGPLELH